MVTVVIVINVVLALLCLYTAWQVLKFRRVLAQVTATLSAAERSTHRTLYRAPEAILKGQAGTQYLRQQYRQLQMQLGLVQQILALLSLGQVAWRSRSQSLPLLRSSGRSGRSGSSSRRR